MGKSGVPLLLMSGTLDEFIPAAQAQARTDARVELFPRCDHVLELYDARLVNAAVQAACATVGKAPPCAPYCWRWRLAGMAMGWLGALGLAKVALVVCGNSARLRPARTPLFALILLGANAALMGTWIGATPHLRWLPWQIGSGIIVWLALKALGRLRIPRWSLLALTGTVAMAGAILHSYGAMLFGAFFFLALLAGTICGRIVAHRGTERDGDIAFAIFAGYNIGQWIIKPI